MSIVEANEVTKVFSRTQRERSLFKSLRGVLGGASGPPRSPLGLNGVSFRLEKGEKLGIVGKNGAGKTTLLRLIAGIFRPNSGTIAVAARPTCLMNLSAGMFGELSAEDNAGFLAQVVFDGGRPSSDEIETILDTAGLTELRELPVKHLSRGQLQRLSLSAFCHAKPELLLFDEALASVDREFSMSVERRIGAMNAAGLTAIYASHDLEFLRRHCDRVLWLREGRIDRIGEASSVLDAYIAATGES